MRMAGARALSLENITSILKQHKEELNVKYGVGETRVFGSYLSEARDFIEDVIDALTKAMNYIEG